MRPLTTERLIEILSSYVQQTGASVDLILVGALALQAYGQGDRFTRDVDAEVSGSLDLLFEFLRKEGIPADLTQNLSGWSIVAMPPGYRQRASELINQPNLRIRVLSPVDFIIAKLRRGTELDCDDAAYVARRFTVTRSAIQAAASAAISASPQDTALFLFRTTVDLFCSSLPNEA